MFSSATEMNIIYQWFLEKTVSNICFFFNAYTQWSGNSILKNLSHKDIHMSEKLFVWESFMIVS